MLLFVSNDSFGILWYVICCWLIFCCTCNKTCILLQFSSPVLVRVRYSAVAFGATASISWKFSVIYFAFPCSVLFLDILHRWTCLYEQLDCGIIMCFQLLQYVASPVSGHFDFTIPYFVVKGKQIRTIHCKDLSTSLLSSVLFAAELRFV